MWLELPLYDQYVASGLRQIEPHFRERPEARPIVIGGCGFGERLTFLRATDKD
jgi:hypothetical protein